MSCHILFKGIHFALPYSTQTWNAYFIERLLKIKKTGKIKHAFNKDKTRSIIFKRKPKVDVSFA